MRARYLRIGWTVMSIIIVQSLVCGLALVPVALLWHLLNAQPLTPAVRIVVQSLLIVPSYVLFASALLVVSPAATWLTRARTPENATLRIVDLDWPLLKWVEYMAATHVVRVFAGPLLRGSPLWTAYLRLNGARLGRGVHVNSLSISDHNLLEFGDHVVIGADAHVSGHTVEGGLVKTGRVKLGRDVTIGLGSVIEIGVDIGSEAQIGALSFVPKHTRFDGGVVYAGIPARPLDRAAAPLRTIAAAHNIRN